MVAADGCHDPIVFGHDPFCELGLGPAMAVFGPARRSDFRSMPLPDISEPPPPPVKVHPSTARKNARQAALNDTLAILRRKLSGSQ